MCKPTPKKLQARNCCTRYIGMVVKDMQVPEISQVQLNIMSGYEAEIIK